MATKPLVREATLAVVLALHGLAAVAGQPSIQRGEASFYADSLVGNATASGEPYDSGALTAAHRSLAFGTTVRVTYLKSGESVEVVINDRGPFVKGRVIDLSRAAAERLDMIDDGHGPVTVEVIDPPAP